MLVKVSQERSTEVESQSAWALYTLMIEYEKSQPDSDLSISCIANAYDYWYFCDV